MNIFCKFFQKLNRNHDISNSLIDITVNDCNCSIITIVKFKIHGSHASTRKIDLPLNYGYGNRCFTCESTDEFYVNGREVGKIIGAEMFIRGQKENFYWEMNSFEVLRSENENNFYRTENYIVGAHDLHQKGSEKSKSFMFYKYSGKSEPPFFSLKGLGINFIHAYKNGLKPYTNFGTQFSNSFLIGQSNNQNDDRSEYGLTPTPTPKMMYLVESDDDHDDDILSKLEYEIPDNDFKELSEKSDQMKVFSIESEPPHIILDEPVLNQNLKKFNWRKVNPEVLRMPIQTPVDNKRKISLGSNPEKNFSSEILVYVQIFGDAGKRSKRRKLKIEPEKDKKITFDIPEGKIKIKLYKFKNLLIIFLTKKKMSFFSSLRFY